jgi:hypothetical protein
MLVALMEHQAADRRKLLAVNGCSVVMLAVMWFRWRPGSGSLAERTGWRGGPVVEAGGRGGGLMGGGDLILLMGQATADFGESVLV